MEYKIEKGILIPPPVRRTKYPFGQMEVGDSVFIADDGGGRVIAAACEYGKRHNKKFSCRTVDGGVRVWRIE